MDALGYAMALLFGLLGGLLLGILAGRRALVRAEDRASARRARDADEAYRQVEELRDQVSDAMRAEAMASAELDAAHERLASERQAAQRRVDQLIADRAILSDQFEALAAKALQRNTEQFLSVADQRLRRTEENHAGELARRHALVEQLVDPLNTTLAQVREELRTAETARAQSTAALRTEVELIRDSAHELGSRTLELANALRAPHVRGRWGEMQLRRVVEAAGLLDRVDFVEQQVCAVEDADGQERVVRPDLVVHLTERRTIVVDAKVPFLAYLEATEATDATAREDRLATHAKQLRRHIEQLASKKYWEALDTSPEFVVMFVPADAFLDAAMRKDPSLLDFGFDRHVVLATPTTLMALLRTVAYGWRSEALTRNAEEVHRLGKELYKRVTLMNSHLSTVGRRLDSAVEAYNRTISSMESRVLVSARRLGELEVISDDLPTPAPIDRRARVTDSVPQLDIADTLDFPIAQGQS